MRGTQQKANKNQNIIGHQAYNKCASQISETTWTINSLTDVRAIGQSSIKIQFDPSFIPYIRENYLQDTLRKNKMMKILEETIGRFFDNVEVREAFLIITQNFETINFKKS